MTYLVISYMIYQLLSFQNIIHSTSSLLDATSNGFLSQMDIKLNFLMALQD